MKSLKETIEDMLKLMELAAIWLDSKVVVETENGELLNTLRITKGMHIRVVSGTILDIREDAPANYTVLKCLGDIYSSQLQMELISNSGEILKLILK